LKVRVARGGRCLLMLWKGEEVAARLEGLPWLTRAQEWRCRWRRERGKRERRTLVTSMVQEWRVREVRAGQRSLTASTVAAVNCSAGSQLARTGRSVWNGNFMKLAAHR